MAAIGATAAPAGEENASFALRWYVLFIMMLAYTINIADRYVMSTVLEQIRIDLKLSDGGVAFLTGVSLALFYVGMGIPLSWIADRYNRRNLLAISITLWSVMTTLCGLSKGYTQLLLARMGVGVGEAGGTPSCNSIICDYFPAPRRPMALTIFCLGAPIGAWIGADMAGAVANAYGWRAAFLEFPGRFVLGTDTFTPERWHYVAEHARWSREWLADLPLDVAERIGWKNGEALFTAMLARKSGK